MDIKTEFDIGEIVICVSDPQATPGQVTDIQLCGKNYAAKYGVQRGMSNVWHYDFELTRPKEEKKVGFENG